MNRLEELLQIIRQNQSDERNFKVLYRELITEINTQRSIQPDRSKNSYLHNLEQTWEKQLMTYVRSKLRKEENSQAHYEIFASNFKMDVTEILTSIK